MKKSFIIYLSALILGACVNTELSKNTNFDPTKDARIRLYGQNGRPTFMEFFNNGKVEKVNVGGSFGNAFISFIGLKGSESIGVTESEFSKDPSAFSGFLSRAYFKEFIIPAGVEVSLNNGILGRYDVHRFPDRVITIKGGGCTGEELVFTPKAGKDYEAIPYPEPVCGLRLRELN